MERISFTKEQREYFIDSIKNLCPEDLTMQKDPTSLDTLDELNDYDLPYITFIKASNDTLRWMKLDTFLGALEQKKNYFTNKILNDNDRKSIIRLTGIVPLILGATMETEENREAYWKTIYRILDDEKVECPIRGGVTGYKYKGRNYKLRKGIRGGTFILVKGEKIYIR